MSKKKKRKSKRKRNKKDGYDKNNFYLSPNSGLYLSKTLMEPHMDYINETPDKLERAAREMVIFNIVTDILEPPEKPKEESKSEPEKPKEDDVVKKRKEEDEMI